MTINFKRKDILVDYAIIKNSNEQVEFEIQRKFNFEPTYDSPIIEIGKKLDSDIKELWTGGTYMTLQPSGDKYHRGGMTVGAPVKLLKSSLKCYVKI